MVFTPIGILLVVIIILLLNGVRVLREYERAVIFRLGRMACAC